MIAGHQPRAEISAFVADELERQTGQALLPDQARRLEALLLAFLGCELWLWEAPDHAAAQAALTALRFTVPTPQRAGHQRHVACIQRTLRDQAARLARLERAMLLQQEELIMLSEELKRAREPPS